MLTQWIEPGSSAFSRYPSVIMNLSPHEMQDCAIIEFTTRNFKNQMLFAINWTHLGKRAT